MYHEFTAKHDRSKTFTNLKHITMVTKSENGGAYLYLQSGLTILAEETYETVVKILYNFAKERH